MFELGQAFDKSDKYMKFGRNWVINDYVKVTTSANRPQAAAILTAILVIVYRTKSILNMSQSLIKVIHI